MDVLRNLFGNVASGIIRLLVAVGILAAAYFFIVRPVLDTTENVSDTIGHSVDSTNRQIEQARKETSQAFGPRSKTAKDIRRAQRQAQKASPGSDQVKVLRCVQRANGDVYKMQRCTRRY